MFNLKNDLTEEELWVWIRTQPKILPQGKKELFTFTRISSYES